MEDKEMLSLIEVEDGVYWDQHGVGWDLIPEEDCEECGSTKCYCSDLGERLCKDCLDEKYEVWWR